MQVLKESVMRSVIRIRYYFLHIHTRIGILLVLRITYNCDVKFAFSASQWSNVRTNDEAILRYGGKIAHNMQHNIVGICTY